MIQGKEQLRKIHFADTPAQGAVRSCVREREGEKVRLFQSLEVQADILLQLINGPANLPADRPFFFLPNSSLRSLSKVSSVS